MSTGAGTLTPISAAGYATLAELRASPELKLKDSERDDDGLLQTLLDAITSFIETRRGRVFVAGGDSTRYFDASQGGTVDGRTLYVRADLCAITTIVNGDGETLDASDYVTLPRNLLDVNHPDYAPLYAIQLKASSGKSWTFTDDPEGAIAITGKWAYGLSVRADMKQAVIIGAAALYRMSLSSEGDRPIIAGGGIIIEPSRLPSTFFAVIDAPSYQRWVS